MAGGGRKRFTPLPPASPPGAGELRRFVPSAETDAHVEVDIPAMQPTRRPPRGLACPGSGQTCGSALGATRLVAEGARARAQTIPTISRTSSGFACASGAVPAVQRRLGRRGVDARNVKSIWLAKPCLNVSRIEICGHSSSRKPVLVPHRGVVPSHGRSALVRRFVEALSDGPGWVGGRHDQQDFETRSRRRRGAVSLTLTCLH